MTLMKTLYAFEGIVRKGNQRGRDLGFPTANIELSLEIPSGIYISFVTIDDVVYPSLTFVGEAKTFHETRYQAEAYILDFNKDIYGKLIKIKIIEKLRENEKFTSVKDLVIQMKEDETNARKFFAKLPNVRSM
jgi:riboflavin kinase/FMN adenylyltransferase